MTTKLSQLLRAALAGQLPVELPRVADSAGGFLLGGERHSVATSATASITSQTDIPPSNP